MLFLGTAFIFFVLLLPKMVLWVFVIVLCVKNIQFIPLPNPFQKTEQNQRDKGSFRAQVSHNDADGNEHQVRIIKVFSR